MSKRGFTLLELLLTVVTLSVLAAFTFVRFFSRPQVTLENAAVLLARDLRAAQNRSTYLSEPCLFTFTEDGEGYEVTDLDGNVVRNPRTELSFRRWYAEDGVFAGVLVESVHAGGDRTLTYDARGLALEDLEVTLVQGSQTRVVRVERGAGRVTIEGATSDWVDRGH